ncbi:poly-beta-hydroxybutyrate polymerase N-terminal domain-containing protein [Sphingobium scionense]
MRGHLRSAISLVIRTSGTLRRGESRDGRWCPDARARPLDRIAESLHRTVVAAVTRMTSGLSPTTLDKALTDWSHHFAFSPGKSPQLDGQAGGNIAPLFGHLIRSAHQRDAAPAIEPHPQDRGFSDRLARALPLASLS